MKPKIKKHVTVFTNIGTNKPLGVYIATVTPEGRLGERVSEIVLEGFCGSLPDALAAYNRGDYGDGSRILHNLA